MRGCEARRSAADYGDALLAQLSESLRSVVAELVAVGVHPVGGKALQVADGDRGIDLGAVAFRLAGVLADAPADRRQGTLLADDLVGLLEAPLADKGDVRLRVDAGRAGELAGRFAVGLGDGEGVGHRLRVFAEDGLALAEAAVEGALQVDGADFSALTAAVALRQVDVTGIALDGHVESAGLAADAFDLAQRDDLDVLVAAALDQLGREDAHRTVAGRERLVELGHAATDGGGALDEVDLEAGVGQVKRRLDAGDAAAIDEDGAAGTFLGHRATAFSGCRMPFRASSGSGSTRRLRRPSCAGGRPRARPRSCVK